MQGYIAGIVGVSTVDWPGKVCSVIFFAGCNLRCKYCYNSQILEQREEFLKDLEEVKEEIKRGLPLIDAILFSGGEPTLQKEVLEELASWAMKKGLEVGIETNGTMPNVLKQLYAKELIHFIAMDVKTVLEPKKYEEVVGRNEEIVERVKESIRFIKRCGLEYEFRITLVPGLITLDDAKRVYDSLKPCKLVLQCFRWDKGELVDKSLKGRNFSAEEVKEILKWADEQANVMARFF